MRKTFFLFFFKIKSAFFSDPFVMDVTVNSRIKLLAACSVCLKDTDQTSDSLLPHRHFISWKKINKNPELICICKLNKREGMKRK